MSERAVFLKALAENEDDTTTRLVFADWLDEQGEHEEADRMRKWPAAKEWFVRFCQDDCPPDDFDNSNSWFHTYKRLLELGREAVANATPDAILFSCGTEEWLHDILTANKEAFWQNWSIVTGIPLPPITLEKYYFTYLRCPC